MLGKLAGRLGVELSTQDLVSSKRIPLGINLTDRNVEVPLMDWGSGTQNKTKILMSLLQTNRIKLHDASEAKVTPYRHYRGARELPSPVSTGGVWPRTIGIIRRAPDPNNRVYT